MATHPRPLAPQTDFDRLRRLKEQLWLDRRDRLGPAGMLAEVAHLQAHVRARRDDWPSDDERAADLAHHVHLARLLRHAG